MSSLGALCLQCAELGNAVAVGLAPSRTHTRHLLMRVLSAWFQQTSARATCIWKQCPEHQVFEDCCQRRIKGQWWCSCEVWPLHKADLLHNALNTHIEKL